MRPSDTLSAQFVHALDLHKAEIKRLRSMVCECGHADDFPGYMHDEGCPARPPDLRYEDCPE